MIDPNHCGNARPHGEHSYNIPKNLEVKWTPDELMADPTAAVEYNTYFCPGTKRRERHGY